MVIATATLKGQVVIPAPLRHKYHIHKGSRLAILDGEGQIIIKPVPKDPIKAAFGFIKKVKGQKSPLEALMEDRVFEAKQ